MLLDDWGNVSFDPSVKPYKAYEEVKEERALGGKREAAPRGVEERGAELLVCAATQSWVVKSERIEATPGESGMVGCKEEVGVVRRIRKVGQKRRTTFQPQRLIKA